jgi:hypothetical protein
MFLTHLFRIPSVLQAFLSLRELISYSSLQDLRPISLLSTTGRPFKKVVLKIVQRHAEEKNLLNASQFGARARHNTTLQSMRLTDHVTLNNVKVKLSLCLSKYRAMKTYWGSGGIAPRILDLGTRWR